MTESSVALVGRCFCGKVGFQSSAAPYGMTFCYCCTCRSLHGAPFAAFTNVVRENFSWTETEGLTYIHASQSASRAVCQFCHAPMTMVYHAAPDEIGIAAASIDERLSKAEVPKVNAHIYVAEKPGWYTIADGAPQLEGPSEEIERWLEQR